MKATRFYLFTMLPILWTSSAVSQDCTLCIGGPDTEMIVQVFQLSDEQQLQMANWAKELALYHEDMSMQIRELFETHPQQSKDDLEQLASKYKVMKEEIEATAKSYDRKLITTFDDRQYARYQALCQEVHRLPMTIQ